MAPRPPAKLPKLAALMDHAEPDLLAYMSFPPQHRAKLHSTNPLERLNGEIKRRTEWTVQRARYITLESIAPVSDDPIVSLPIAAD
jgi:putative transposase